MSDVSYPRSDIEDLIDGKMPWEKLKGVLSAPKDPGRFLTYLSILQDRVSFEHKIILPLGPHLYIVQMKDTKEWKIISDAGYVFCNWNENWKLYAHVYVRETPEQMREVYPHLMAPDTEWQIIREYICPISGALLEIEAPVPWYPVLHDAKFDIDTFYRDWLGIEPPERTN